MRTEITVEVSPVSGQEWKTITTFDADNRLTSTVIESGA